MSFLGDLLVRLKVETADFTQDMGKAAHVAEQSMSKIQKAGAALGATLSVGAFTLFLRNAIDAADKLHDLSISTQVSAMQLGGLGYAASQAGSSLEGAASSFGKMNKSIAEALAGKEGMVKTFANLGVTLNDLKTMNPQEVFLKLATSFREAEDGANKAGHGAKIFGKGYMDILPMLDEGGAKLAKQIEYYQQYSGMTQELVDKSDALKDEMTKLHLLTGAFGNAILSELLDPMKLLVDQMVKLKENSHAAHDALSVFLLAFQALAVVGLNVAFTFETIGKEIARAMENARLIATGDWAGSRALGTMFAEDAAKARKELDALTDRILKLGKLGGIPGAVSGVPFDIGNLEGGQSSKGGRKLPNMPGSDQKVAAELKRYETAAQGLEKQLFALHNAGQLMLLQYETEQGTLKGLTAEHKESLLVLARKIDMRHRELEINEAVQKQLADENAANDRRNDILREQNASFSQARQDQAFELSMIGKTAREMEALNAARQIELNLRKDIASLPKLDEGATSSQIRANLEAENALRERAKQQTTDIIDGINARQAKEREWSTGANLAFKNYADSAMNAAANAQQFWSSAFQKMEDALVDFATTGKLDFKKLADSIIADLVRIQIKAAITGPIAESMKSNGGSLFSAAGDWFKNLLPSYDVGTDYVPHDMIAQIHQGEKIIPAGEGGGGTVIHQYTTINVDSRTDQSQIYVIARDAARRENAKLLDSMGRGNTAAGRAVGNA